MEYMLVKTSEYEASTLKVVQSVITLPLSLIKIADFLAITGKEVYSYLCTVNLLIPLQQTGKLMHIFVMYSEEFRSGALNSYQKSFQGKLYILKRIEQYDYSSSPQLKHVNKMHRTLKLSHKCLSQFSRKLFSNLNRCAHAVPQGILYTDCL